MNSHRVVIIGGPRTGKTTLARELAKRRGVPARHTDDVKQLGWSEASAEVANWFDLAGEWVIEGVAAARAMRKWLSVNPGAFDAKVIVLRRPYGRPNNGQVAMSRGVETVWREIRDTLVARGAEIEERAVAPAIMQGKVSRRAVPAPPVTTSVLADQESLAPTAHAG